MEARGRITGLAATAGIALGLFSLLLSRARRRKATSPMPRPPRSARRDDDARVVARVRAHLIRVVARPEMIEVICDRGRVALLGSIAPGEVRSLLAELRSLPGVVDVDDRLTIRLSKVAP